MKWSNLKSNKCPKCGRDFMVGLIPNPFLLKHSCGFAIREARYRQIVASQVTAGLEEELNQEFEENL